MAIFAERLKELRNERHITQDELAKKLNVANGTIGNYEGGKREPKKLKDLENIADFFNVDLDYLVGRTNKRPEFSLEEQWIIMCYRNADADTQNAIKTLIRKFDKKDTSFTRVS